MAAVRNSEYIWRYSPESRNVDDRQVPRKPRLVGGELHIPLGFCYRSIEMICQEYAV
jgi:hypothetical protein